MRFPPGTMYSPGRDVPAPGREILSPESGFAAGAGDGGGNASVLPFAVGAVTDALEAGATDGVSGLRSSNPAGFEAPADLSSC